MKKIVRQQNYLKALIESPGNVFLTKHLSRSLTMLMMYYVLLKHPFSCLYDFNLIPQTNIRELVLIIVGMPNMFISFGAGIAIAIIAIIEKYIHLSGFHNELDMADFVLSCHLLHIDLDFCRLDLSNSFLYSNKTQSLLE